MAHIKIEDIVDHLDLELKRALESAVEDVLPDVTVDRSELFRSFRRAVGRKCKEWIEVPDEFVRSETRPHAVTRSSPVREVPLVGSSVAPDRRSVATRNPRSNSGKNLNREWNVGAAHALYRLDGKWYMPLKKFPGALFDKHGYIRFRTREDYEGCKYLRIGVEVTVPDGINRIPGYVRMVQ